MTILRNIKKSNFTIIDNGFVNDKNLSLKGKGLMLYLLSKPDDWQVFSNEIVKNSKDGKASVAKALKELEELGYIEREFKRGESGDFIGGYNYCVYETSIKAIENNKENNKSDIEDEELSRYEKIKSEKWEEENWNSEKSKAENPNSIIGKAEKSNAENPNSKKPNAENRSLLNTEYKLNTKYKLKTEAKRKTKYIPNTKTITTTTITKDDNSSCSSYNEDIYNIYLENGFGKITKGTIKIIDSYIKEYSKEEVEKAFLEAIKKDKCNLSYVQGILINWSKERRGTCDMEGTSYKSKIDENSLWLGE